MSTNPILVTIDVEDWQQSTFDRNLPISQRSADNTLRLLDNLDAFDIKTTMFILGKFAKSYPEVIKEIANRGHEIACHGFGHIEIFTQERDVFLADVKQSKELLEQLIGEEVLGYRAPDFSITKDSLWALEVLTELGFQYDSSIFPIDHKRYGIPGWPNTIKEVILPDKSSIIEIPLSVYKFRNRNIPVSGGGYFRLWPNFLSMFFSKNILKTRPFIFYCHPYEIDKDGFKFLDFNVPLFTRLHQGLGRGYFLERFESLVKGNLTMRIKDLLDSKNKKYPAYDINNSYFTK